MIVALSLAAKLSLIVSLHSAIPNNPFEDDPGIFLILVC